MENTRSQTASQAFSEYNQAARARNLAVQQAQTPFVAAAQFH